MSEDYAIVFNLCRYLAYASGYMSKSHPSETASFDRAIERGKEMLQRIDEKEKENPHG